MTGRERILAMIEGRTPDHLPLMPITMMFAADTAGVTYREYASDYRALAEAQLRTAETYGFDHVSAISDPAREASDLGAAVEWFDHQPPAIVESRALLEDKSELARLEILDPWAGPRMSDRLRGIALLRERAGGALMIEGWVEGPCALGADLRGVNTLMLDLIDDPAFVKDLFEFAVATELRFARAQKGAGAELMGIGDAASSLVGPRLYEQQVLPYQQKLVAGLKEIGLKVRLHICGNTRKMLTGMGSLGCEIVDLDYLSPLAEGRAAMGPQQVLLGNIDPVRVLRDGTPESIEAALADCYAQAAPSYIVGAGCEVPRGTPPANLLAMTRFAREHGC